MMNREVAYTPHFTALDSIRGLAALSVAFGHMGWLSIIWSQSYVKNSYLMVDLFFVLSGFVIFYAYGDRIKSAHALVRFMWLRFWRLYPLHFAFLLVFVGLECLKWSVQSGLGIAPDTLEQSSLTSFLVNVILAQSLGVSDHLSFNYPSWSISAEFYTYIVFGAAVLWIGKRQIVLVASAFICVTAFLALVLLGPEAVTLTFDLGIVRCLTGFFLGVLTFAAYRWVSALESVRLHAGMAGYAAVCAIAAFAVFLQVKSQGYSDLAIYPLSAAVVFLVALAPSTGPIGVLSTKPFAWLGTISYSIYMVHASVLWCVKQAMRFGLHVQTIEAPKGGVVLLAPGAILGLVAFIFAVALVLIVSHFTYSWIEKPFRDWSKSAWPRVQARFPQTADARG